MRSHQRHTDMRFALPLVHWEAEIEHLRCRSVGGEVSVLGFPLARWMDEAGFLSETLFIADQKRFLEQCRAAMEDRPSVGQYRVLAADGLTRPFQVALHAVHKKRAVWLRGQMVALPQPEEAPCTCCIPREERTLGSIVSRFDHALRHLYVSASAQRLVGLPPAAFLGKTNEELGMPPALVRTWREYLLRVFRRGERAELEFQFLKPEAEAPAQLVRVQSRLEPAFDARGDVRSVLSHAQMFPVAPPRTWTRRAVAAAAASPAVELTGKASQPFRVAPSKPRASSLSAEERCEWMIQVNQALATHPVEEALYSALERLAVPMLGDWGGIAMLRDQRLEHVALFSQAPVKAQPPWVRPFPFNTRVVLAGRAQLLSEPCERVLEELAQDDEHHQQLEAVGLQDFMAVPLFQAGVCCGCLWFASEDPRARLGLGELRLAEQLALLASPALEAARLRRTELAVHERKIWLERKTEGLRRVAAALGEALLPVQVADAVMREVKSALGAWAAVVYRIDAKGSALELLRASGYSAEATRGFEQLPLAMITPITDAVRKREGVWVESAEAFRRDYAELASRVPPRPGARVALPLLIEGRALGVLAMIFETDRGFSKEERAFGIVLAQLCAQALDRVQLYLRLQDQLEEFRTLLDVLPIGIRISRDRDCEAVEQNPAFTRLLGLPVEQNSMQRGHAAEPPPEVRVFRQGRELELEDQPLQRAAATGHPLIDFEMEVEVERAGGPRRTVLSYVAPLFDRAHRPHGAIGAFLDITERKSATEALRFLADSGPVLSASLEPEQTYQALTRLCVPTLSRLALLYEGMGQRLRLVSCAHAQSSLEPLLANLGGTKELLESPLVQRALMRGRSLALDVSRATARGRPENKELGELLRKLGVRGFLLLPLVASKRMVGLLVCGLAEEGASQETRTLARALAPRAALAMDNVRLYREAREAISLRDEFLGVAGHELRTPLTALQLSMRNLARASHNGDLAKMEKWAAQCQSQGVRLGRLVNDLLDVSRITSGRLPLQYEDVDFSALVEECVTRMASSFEEVGCTVTVTKPGPIVGRWDAMRLEQVVTNLLSNAMKYGKARPVKVSLFSTSEQAVVRVQDHGIGIAPEDQARIFQRFERAVSESHYWGMGLGLWIVQELVTRLGGQIEVESVLGQGATFTVYLPRRATQAQPST